MAQINCQIKHVGVRMLSTLIFNGNSRGKSRYYCILFPFHYSSEESKSQNNVALESPLYHRWAILGNNP